MADFLDNLELGAAGGLDLVTGALSTVTGGLISKSHEAASVYASQTARDRGIDDVQTNAIEADATAKEDAGAVLEAAHQTVDQVADKVAGAFSFGKWVLAAAVVVAGVVLVKRYTPAPAK